MTEDTTSGNTVLAWFGNPDIAKYQLYVLVLAGVLLLTAPIWGAGLIFVLAIANIWAMLAMGWDIISGHTGYISFGHSFLTGVAAYTTAITIFKFWPEAPIYFTMPLSIVMAVIAGMLFALPSLRLSGPYFSLMTFVSVLIADKLIYIFSGYTNAEMGISGITSLYNYNLLYYITLVPMVIVGAILLFLSRSNFGLVLKAIHENEYAVESVGLDTTKFKLWGFTISAVVMGIGGVMLAHAYGTVEPKSVLIVDLSIQMIAMAAVGGMGTILGPAGGAYVLLILRDGVFQALAGPTARWVLFWATVLVLLVVPAVKEDAPNGVFRWLWQYLGELSEESEADSEAVADGGERE